MNVETWTAVPLRRSNATALASAACAMVFLLAYEPEELDRIEFMRASAVILIALHAAFHIGTLNALRLMAQFQVDRAAEAPDDLRDALERELADVERRELSAEEEAIVVARLEDLGYL